MCCSHCLIQGHHISVCTESANKQGIEEETRRAHTDGKSKGGDGISVDRPKKDDRGRTNVRVTMLRSTLDLHSMCSRSETPKRRQSGEKEKEKEKKGKMMTEGPRID